MEIEAELTKEEDLEDITKDEPVCFYCGTKDKVITRYVVNACFDCLKEVTKDDR